MRGTEKSPHIFGIRHLSPGGAYHLLKLLEAVKPTAVLVEGLSDANPQIEFFTAGETRLPIAVLAYTEDLPVRTLLYPIAEYSPEYQALLWAGKNQVHAEFIDLPSEVFLELEHHPNAGEMDPGADAEVSIYMKWARLAGEQDFDSYWERSFEHNLNHDAYRLAAFEFGRSLRELDVDNRYKLARNMAREAYMRGRIQNAIRLGHRPEQIVVVTGAYHAPALGGELPAMNEEEYDRLPRVKTKLTLMPYSYYRLSSKSGYGAGNNAPAYYNLMWDCLRGGDLARLPSLYLSNVVSHLRESGTPRSAAGAIEGVRLANALAALYSGSAPTLRDLRDAAIVCLGHGELAVVAEAVARTEVGTAIGSLPEGVSRTSIQEDFYRELKRLKLEKYHTAVALDLDLDLRENRRVASEEAAFLDLNRSFFLHRLKLLNVSFQKLKPTSQKSATWAEAWVLQWMPEAEIELVESSLKGETIKLAAALVFKESLSRCVNIGQAAAIIKEACRCGMMDSMEQARRTLQGLAVDNSAFNEIAGAAAELAAVISYGDIRRFDPAPLVPLLQQLFLRGTLLLLDAAACDNNTAGTMVDSMHRLNSVALEHDSAVDEELWLKKLAELSDRDDKNPRLSGYACALLLERNLINGGKLAQEVSRRLSPGIMADLGAGWFEGLSMRNKYALLARINLWEQLDRYIASLDREQFSRALVFLRRAFGGFAPAEKRAICENLGEIWGIGGDNASDMLNRELSEEEKQTLDGLNDFDFGDI